MSSHEHRDPSSRDEVKDPHRRVDVTISSPRPSARALQSTRERESALDFDVCVEISTCRPRDLMPTWSVEGEVSLWMGRGGWQPCRSAPHGPDAGWIHGSLPAAVRDLRHESGSIGVDVSRRLIEVLSGVGWPTHSFFRTPSAEALGIYHRASIELHRDAVIPGDVVVHANSGRSGVVVQTGKIHADATVEHLVWSPSRGDEEVDMTWLNSRHLRLAARGPYRRYLALVALEDDGSRRIRRSRRPHSRHGGSLTPEAWDQMYWHLCNRRRLRPDGQTTYRDLGRERWNAAAIDCLERRDHARQTSWLDAEGRSREAASPPPFEMLLRSTYRDP
jgi:hypothetical protein